MNVIDWLRGRISPKYRSEWLYRRGMVRARLKAYESAIADYSTVIETAESPADVRAMALYNRALVYDATARGGLAAADLRVVIEMPSASEKVRTEARRRMLRMQRADDRTTH